MSEASDEELIEDAMMIDEAENFQEDLINNNVRNDAPNTRVEHEGKSDHKDSLSKHATSGTACQKLLNRTKSTNSFSHYRSINTRVLDLSAASVLIEEDNNTVFYLSDVLLYF